MPVPPDLEKGARDAWLFVLPLIEVAALRARSKRPINALVHRRALTDPTSTYVTTPNNDTLYSSAFLNTSEGPVVLEIPDTGTRYLSVQIMDMYTNNNFILGPRTPGGAAGQWRIISPASEPRESRDLRLATPNAWLIARVLVDGPTDLPAAHAVQDRLHLLGSAASPPASNATPTSGWPVYFAAAEQLLRSDPPPFKNGLDAFMKVRDASRARDFSRAGYPVDAATAIDAGVAEAIALTRSGGRLQSFINGWAYPRPDLGEYGDNFVFRALAAAVGLGALNPAEAMYMRAAGDGHGLFEGDGLYRLSLPGPVPVDGFWSLTMYRAMPDGRFFLAENSLARYAIGDRTDGPERGLSGGLDIWIGRSDPGGKRTANWLPAPKEGPFALILRAYLPRPELLNGIYRLPPIVQV